MMFIQYLERIDNMEVSFTDVTVCGYSKMINARAIVDADVIVPDTHPDIGTVLAVRASAESCERYIKKDKMVFSGNLKFNILYACEEETGRIYTIEHSIPFSHQTDSNGIDEDAFTVGTCHISKTDFNVRNSRKLRVEAELSLPVRAYKQNEIKAVNGVDSDSDIPVRYSDCEGDRIVLCREIEFDVSDSVALPPDECSEHEIYDVSYRSDISDVKTVNNKAVIKGIIPIKILYGTENGVQSYDTDISFTEIEDLETSGASDRISSVFDVADLSCSLSQSESGIKADAEIKIRGRICIYDRCEYHVASDIYSPDYEYTSECEKSDLADIAQTSVNQTTVKDTVTVSDLSHPVSKILYMTASTSQTDTVLADSSVTVSGMLHSTVIYQSEDGGLHSVSKNTPYEITESVSDGCNSACAELEVSNYSYIMGSPNEIQLRCVVRSITDSLKCSKKSFITAFSIDSEKPVSRDSQPSITVCYPDPDITLWDIAKKYSTTVGEIEALNSVSDGDTLSRENPLLIAKRTGGIKA